jgi:hypothetical protein
LVIAKMANWTDILYSYLHLAEVYMLILNLDFYKVRPLYSLEISLGLSNLKMIYANQSEEDMMRHNNYGHRNI